MISKIQPSILQGFYAIYLPFLGSGKTKAVDAVIVVQTSIGVISINSPNSEFIALKIPLQAFLSFSDTAAANKTLQIFSSHVRNCRVLSLESANVRISTVMEKNRLLTL